jgi:hypothetical protein
MQAHAWPAPLYNIFPDYLINDIIFGQKVTGHKNMCFDFLYNFCLKHFSFLEEISEKDQKRMLVFT